MGVCFPPRAAAAAAVADEDCCVSDLDSVIDGRYADFAALTPSPLAADGIDRRETTGVRSGAVSAWRNGGGRGISPLLVLRPSSIEGNL